jgi:hypothetical protein
MTRKPNQSLSLAQIGLFMTLLLVSGSTTFCVSRYIALSKNADECDRLIAQLNEGHRQVLNFQVKDATATDNLARNLEQMTVKLGSVELGNPQLRIYRSEFARVYRELGQNYQQMGQAWSKASQAKPTHQGQQTIQKEIARVQSVGISVAQTAQEVDRLTQQVNHYCGLNSERHE